MEPNASFGMNRTGAQMSPIDIQKMLEAAHDTHPPSDIDERSVSGLRSEYIGESDGVGSVPLPGSAKGALSSAMQMLGGHSPQVLMDKLGERLAFERTGTRLYEALITKCEASPDSLGTISLQRLLQFHAEEAQHFRVVVEAINHLGGDPTAQTPSADVNGVEAMGLLQVLTDPRTSLAHCLHAVLTAEMVDNAGWELLIELADELGQDELVSRFQAPLRQEKEHLLQIRAWYEQMTLDQAR